MVHSQPRRFTRAITRTRLQATVLLSVCSVAQFAYAAPFFRDDFDRAPGETLQDFPDAEWFFEDPGDQIHSFENGMLTITPLTSNFPAATIKNSTVTSSDFVLQTRVRMEDVDPRQVRPFVFLWGRAQGDQASYFAGYSPDGTTEIGRVLNGTLSALSRGPAEFGSLLDVDVNMEMILFGNQISFTLWPDTVPKPASPQLQVTDDTISQPGAVGLIMNVSNEWQTSGEHIVVDFFSMQPVPEPTSALLVVAGCIPLILGRRRYQTHNEIA